MYLIKNKKIAYLVFVVGILLIFASVAFVFYLDHKYKHDVVYKNPVITNATLSEVKRGIKTTGYKVEYYYEKNLYARNLTGLYPDDLEDNKQVKIVISKDNPAIYILLPETKYKNYLYASITFLITACLMFTIRKRAVRAWGKFDSE